MGSNGQEYSGLGKRAGGFVAGLLVGGLVGAGSMLLLAPQSGEKTRAKLEHDGLELRGQVTGTVQDAMAQARSTASRVTARMQEQTKVLQQRGEAMLDQKKEAVSEAIEAGKEAAHNIASC